MHPFGRFDGVTTTDLGVVAVRQRARRSGRSGGAASRPLSVRPRTEASRPGHKVLGRLGMTGMPIVDVEAGCASGGAALALAARARSKPGRSTPHSSSASRRCPAASSARRSSNPGRRPRASLSTPSYFALRAQRLMQTSGVTKEHLAAVVVKNRSTVSTNPDAMFRSEVDAESVLASRVVCEPLHLWMLCSPNEGAAAVVLTKAGHARVGSTEAAGASSAPRCCDRTCQARC